jgi:endo-1,4-beta-xylanase
MASPAWFKSTLNKSNANRYLTEHITTVMRRYAGRIDSWDVVNEPTVFWSKRDDRLYPGIWLNLLGTEYIDIAFHAATDADPKALRVLNVYNVEQGKPEHEITRKATIGLLKQLRARGVPVQAVGIESHLDASVPLGGAEYNSFLQQIRDMGLQILITELDINDTGVQGDFQTRDQVVAKMYQDYLLEVLPVSDAKRVVFWTPSDKPEWDWLNYPKNARADQTPHRPGLLDNAMNRKPAYNAVQSALTEICEHETTGRK